MLTEVVFFLIFLRWNFQPTDEELQTVMQIFDNDFRIPLNFTQTAKPFQPLPYRDYNRGTSQPKAQLNPQTSAFCEKLGVSDPLELLIGKSVVLEPVTNPDEIDLEDDESDFPQEGETKAPEKSEDGSDLFFLDTNPGKPQRSKMSLPTPTTEVWEEPQQKANEDTIQSTSVPNDEVATVAVVADTPKDDEDQQPVVKKLKRRNLELYTEPEDET